MFPRIIPSATTNNSNTHRRMKSFRHCMRRYCYSCQDFYSFKRCTVDKVHAESREAASHCIYDSWALCRCHLPFCANVTSVDVTISVAATNCVIGLVVYLADKHRVGLQV